MRAAREMKLVYDRAKEPEDLPWHSEDPPKLLDAALAAYPDGGRALDVGCGAGVFSVYLARRGFAVTGVDFMGAAISMARERAERSGVTIRLVEADVTEWRSDEPFDLVLDRGCLHMLDEPARRRYRERLGDWLAPGGSYLLGHFLKRHPLDWRPVGPRRLRPEDVVAQFEPELALHAQSDETVRLPLPVGPRVKLGSFWFRQRAAPG
ncbi:MAG TPA: class I SAM-dependent methyltransferase [Thermoleophilaceae bacterium]|jgi:SAM-dependent methyltransferase